jgi:DNA primase
MFNIRKWLNDTGIPFWVHGKNVSEGWTGISCIYCGDRSSHGGFSPNGMVYSCFKCGKKTGIKNFIKDFTTLPFPEVSSIFGRYSNVLDTSYYDTSKREGVASVEWPPKDAEKEMPSIFAQYVHKRGYIPSQIEQLYDVQTCYITGDFKYRLIIPVIENGKVLTYIGRDITGKSKLKYKNLKTELSIRPAKECIYNIDSIDDTAIIVEGVMDVWRLKYNAVAMLGLVFTRKQVRMLAEKLKKAFICFDNEPVAKESAMALGEELSMAGVDVYVVLIDKKDPDCLSESEAEEIRKIISTY